MDIKRLYVTELMGVVETIAADNFISIGSHGATKLWYNIRITSNVVTASFIYDLYNALDIDFIVDELDGQTAIRIPIIYLIIP